MDTWNEIAFQAPDPGPYAGSHCPQTKAAFRPKPDAPVPAVLAGMDTWNEIADWAASKKEWLGTFLTARRSMFNITHLAAVRKENLILIKTIIYVIPE